MLVLFIQWISLTLRTFQIFTLARYRLKQNLQTKQTNTKRDEMGDITYDTMIAM